MLRSPLGALAALFVAVALAGCLGGASSESRGGPADSPPSVYPGDYRFDWTFSQVLVDGPYAALPPERVVLSSALDGAAIEMGIFRPEVPAGERVPVILHASPYYVADPAAASVTSGLNYNQVFLTRNLLPHGYAVASLAVRGTGDSGGCMDLSGPLERADIGQAITWLGTQPWSNGSVGMYGGSYDGVTQWTAASTGNPHLKTIVPIAGWMDLYRDLTHNGSSEYYGHVTAEAVYWPSSFAPTNPGRSPQNVAQGVACPDAPLGMAAGTYSTATGERDPAGWFEARDYRDDILADYRGSVLSITGFEDWTIDPVNHIPFVDQLNRSGIPTKQIYGPWAHAPPDYPMEDNPSRRADWAEILKRWYDRWLKGMDVDTGPAVQVQDNAFAWRDEARFPPADVEWRAFLPTPDGALSEDSAEAGSFLLTQQPTTESWATMFGDPPAGAAAFSAGPLEEPLRLSGLPRFHAAVVPLGPAGYVAAGLYDRSADGTETRLTWAVMNLRFHDGGETAHDLVPGQAVYARMQFVPFDAVVSEGHELILRVWQFNYELQLPSFPTNPVSLEVGDASRTHLALPVVERGPEAFFDPPAPDDA